MLSLSGAGTAGEPRAFIGAGCTGKVARIDRAQGGAVSREGCQDAQEGDLGAANNERRLEDSSSAF